MDLSTGLVLRQNQADIRTHLIARPAREVQHHVSTSAAMNSANTITNAPMICQVSSSRRDIRSPNPAFVRMSVVRGDRTSLRHGQIDAEDPKWTGSLHCREEFFYPLPLCVDYATFSKSGSLN
jgi:hypothetical protein